MERKKKLYEATMIDSSKALSTTKCFFNIHFLAHNFEDAIKEARRIGSLQAAYNDPSCKHECKEVKIDKLNLSYDYEINVD